MKSPWGNWGTAMRASFSDRTEAAVIQLTFSVAASGLLTPIAIYGNVAIQKQVIEFLFKEYVKYMAKEYLKRKRPDHEYLGTYDFQKKNLLYATYRLYSNLNDLIGLYDTEVKSYENVNKLALALNNEINMLTEAVKNAKEVVYHLDVITSNTKELTEFGGIRYKPSETGMYSDMLFTAMYLSLKNELLLKENLLKWFGPDIQISQLICNPAIPAQGQPATFNLTVTNKGASQAAVSGYAAYEVYIDGKSAGKRSGIAKNPLQHNESWTTSFEYIFSSRGTHTVMVKANPDNAVREVLETNNDKSLKLTVDLPDIRVKDVTISPAAPVVNSTKANITVSMENAGKAQAMGIGYSSYKIMVGGKMVWSQAGDATKPPLDPGKTWSTTYTFVFTSAGSNMVSAVVDPDNKVPETVETNNEKTVAINVATPPDLRVKNLSVSPAGPEANYTRAVITATVENIGGAPAGSAGFTAYEAYDGSTRFVKEKGGAPKPPTPPILVPGASTDIVFNYAFPSAGVHTVKFVTDPDNKEPEMLETNNDKAITVNVLPPPPDLVVEGFTCTPSRDWSFKGKGMVSLSVKIKNTGVGPADAAGYAAYDILADGVPVVKARKTAGLPPLAPGNTWTDNNACTFSDGKSTHHLTLKVDPENKVREISEANNEKATDIRMALETVVTPATPLLPDIKVVSMTISPSAPKQRQTATLTVEVENAGKWLCDENGYSSYDLYINDVRATQYRKGSGLGALQAGKTWSTTIPCAFIKAGPNTVKVVMDPENKVKEMDETNNTFIITLKVIEKPVVPGSIN